MEQVCDSVPDYIEEEEVCEFSDMEDLENVEDYVCKGGGTDQDCQEGDVDDEVEESASAGEQGNPQQIHPLQNSVVLSRMFELCSIDDLAKFRLVSKLWYQLSLQSWRASVTITFHSNDLREKGHDFFWEATPTTPIDRKRSWNDSNNSNVRVLRDIYSTTLQKFLYYVEEPSHECATKPYRNFRLDEWELREWDEQIERFTQLCGPSITSLELSDCFFHDLTIFRDVLFKWFPNLKRLVIKNVHCRWFVTPPVEPFKWKEPEYLPQKNLKYLEVDLNHEQLPISWMELFSHFPNLKTLKLYNADVEESVEMMLKAMKIIRKHDPRKLQLKNLDLLAASLYAQDKITPEACLLIRDLKLPLESLTIDFGVDTDPKKVQDILQWHAGTLKELDAYRGPISFPYNDFPFGVQLDKLEELVMSDRLSESLSFIRFTPNLKKLCICDVVEDRPPIISTQIVENTEALLMKDVTLRNCIDLRFDYVISARETKRLIEYLPNVEKLRMPLNEKQFQFICEGWKNLRDFEVLGNMLDDSSITGLSREDVEAINEAESEAVAVENENGEVPANPVVQHSNITDLINLRKFKMSNEDILPTKLMDCSAFHGFLKLPYLQSLHISSQMQDRARNALKEKISDCNVIRIRSSVSQDSYWSSSSSSDSDSD